MPRSSALKACCPKPGRRNVRLRGMLAEAQQSLRRMDALLVDAQAITADAHEASTDLGALRSEVDTNLRKLGRMIDEVNWRSPLSK